jgi:hypothetical protein
MARRKGEVTSAMNERDFPHIIELPLPSGGFRSQSDDMLAFHRERGIEPRRGRGWHNDEQYYVRYCFADPAHADAAQERAHHRQDLAGGRAWRWACTAPRMTAAAHHGPGSAEQMFGAK